MPDNSTPGGITGPRLSEPIALPDGRSVTMRRATPDDAEGIFRLYQLIYEGTYTLPIVNLRDERRRALEDPNTWWLIDEADDGQLVGSVIFSVDPLIRCGKVFAAVTHPEYRRGEVMYHTIGAGVEEIMNRERLVDVIYATTRTKSIGPSGLLRKLGFISLGLFPNVHRLAEYETHGLMAIFHDEAFAKRERLPKLIPEVSGFYDIIRRGFDLEPSEIVPVADRLKLFVLKGAQAAEAYESDRASGELLLHFFPFHRPNILLSTESGSIRAFINREGKDGHGVVVGLRTDRESVAHLEHVLDVVFDTACEIGIEYLELLVDAYSPKHQRAALSAGYLPCAYFPAFEMVESGQRKDYLVFARSQAPLNFSNVQMTQRDRQFLDV